jgi:hypothetical protein
MSAVPVIEGIALIIVQRMKALTIINGYAFDVGEVSRPTNTASVPKGVDKAVMILQRDKESLGDIEANSFVSGFQQVFEVTIFDIPSNKDVSPVDTRINLVESEAIIALTLGKDPNANWQQFTDNGEALAVDSRIAAARRIPSADGIFSGVIIDYEVDYRTPANDPYTALG